MTIEERKSFLKDAKAKSFFGYATNQDFRDHLSADTIDAMLARLEKEIDKESVEFDFKLDGEDVKYYNDFFRKYYAPLVISFNILSGFSPTLTWED